MYISVHLLIFFCFQALHFASRRLSLVSAITSRACHHRLHLCAIGYEPSYYRYQEPGALRPPALIHYLAYEDVYP